MAKLNNQRVYNAGKTMPQTIPQITINRWYKPFPSGLLLFYPHYMPGGFSYGHVNLLKGMIV